MRSGKRPLPTVVLIACLASVPAASQARTQMDEHTSFQHQGTTLTQANGTNASCDADVFLYNYRPRKAKA